MSAEFEIRFNGENRTVRSTTVQALLEEFQLGAKKVAVELNKEIVSRDSYGSTPIKAGDQVEIVSFVGGG
jgi:sulfur carrier protein